MITNSALDAVMRDAQTLMRGTGASDTNAARRPLADMTSEDTFQSSNTSR